MRIHPARLISGDYTGRLYSGVVDKKVEDVINGIKDKGRSRE